MSEVAKGRKQRQNYDISGEDFVYEWSVSRDLDEAVKRMSAFCGRPCSKKFVSNRAAYYRRSGVLLKGLRSAPPLRSFSRPVDLRPPG